mmetsp:Transcript_88628/g.247955  ORF Transcript_88628/g.247955 Transcript_88628/m.247955 type:complete len:437 (+) Transcript_88628:510-1820(+)
MVVHDALLEVDVARLPDAGPDLHGEEPDEEHVHGDARVRLREEVGMQLKVGADGGRVPLPPEIADGCDLVDPGDVDGLAVHMRDEALVVELDAVVVLHPTRVRRLVRLAEAHAQDHAGDGDHDDLLGALELRLEHLESQVLVIGVVLAATNIAALEHGGVASEWAADGAMHVQSVPDPGEEVGAHGDAATARVEGRERPVLRRDLRELGLPQGVEHGIRLFGEGHELGLRRPLLYGQQLRRDMGRASRGVLRGPRDVDLERLVPVQAGLEQPRALDRAVDDVVVMAAEDERELELPAGPLVLRLVQVAERDDEVAPLLLLQLLLPYLHRLPRVVDGRAAERARLVQAGRVREDPDHPDAPGVGAVGREDVDDLAVHLALRILERLVRLHVGVDPTAFVLPLSKHDLAVADVVLVVPPSEVVNGRAVQHRHHSGAVV